MDYIDTKIKVTSKLQELESLVKSGAKDFTKGDLDSLLNEFSKSIDCWYALKGKGGLIELKRPILNIVNGEEYPTLCFTYNGIEYTHFMYITKDEYSAIKIERETINKEILSKSPKPFSHWDESTPLNNNKTRSLKRFSDNVYEFVFENKIDKRIYDILITQSDMIKLVDTIIEYFDRKYIS